MTDTTQSTTSIELHRAAVKYRKKLNKDQLQILQFLSEFRFASSDQLARVQGKPNVKAIQKRLKILEEQELIAKRYDKSYKLRGKPAAYHLTPTGARVLTSLTKRQPDEPINIKSLYRAKDVSEDFIEHCKNILDIYLELIAVYGDSLEFFPKSSFDYEHYDAYPRPLPDAHVLITTNNGTREFYLDVYESHQPFFVMVRRIKKYLGYADSDDWSKESLPTILFVVQHKNMHKRLRKRIAYELRMSYVDELTFATARLADILEPTHKGSVWLPIDEDGDDPDEPVKASLLTRLPSAEE